MNMRLPNNKTYYLLLLMGIFFSTKLCAAEKSECLNDAKAPEVIKTEKGFYILKGKPLSFDPCHSSVRFQIPSSTIKPPLFIFVHGAGGFRDNMRAFNLFYEKGFAVLGFDSFEPNGISKNMNGSVSNAQRQEMIFSATVGAMEWALKQKNIDASRIYLYGVSNGATVVVNVAAMYGKGQIKAVFSEAPAHAGMGMPDDIQVPLVLIFGKQDTYGTPANNPELRWLAHGPCRLNVYIPDAPKGNSFSCNANSSANRNGENHLEWYEKQKVKNRDVQMWLYDDAAHGIFNGELRQQTRSTADGHPFNAPEGSNAEVKVKYLNDLLTYIDKSK
jgi:dienelactone hydrolase